MFLICALPIMLGVLLISKALDVFDSAAILYPTLLIFPLIFPFGLILNIFAIPLALYFFPITVGALYYKEFMKDKPWCCWYFSAKRKNR
jgi:hypothetical protein